jgi:hypothetical protein
VGYVEEPNVAPEPFDGDGIESFLISIGNSGILAGSLSCTGLSLTLGGEVFRRIAISLTGWSSTDSLALNVTSRLIILICSPVSVRTLCKTVGKVTVPDIWNRLRR